MAKPGVRVTFKPNRQGINQLLRSPNGPVGRGVLKAAERTAQRARAQAPVLSGEYRRSIKAGPVRQGPTGPVCSITAAVPYAQSIEHLQDPVLQRALGRLKPTDFRP